MIAPATPHTMSRLPTDRRILVRKKSPATTTATPRARKRGPTAGEKQHDSS